MKKDELICGCGSGAAVAEIQRASLGEAKEYYAVCKGCGITTNYYSSPAEAIAAFRLATRADMKQGIQFEGIVHSADLESDQLTIRFPKYFWRTHKIKAGKVIVTTESIITLPEKE